jgi:hypothetical protein
MAKQLNEYQTCPTLSKRTEDFILHATDGKNIPEDIREEMENYINATAGIEEQLISKLEANFAKVFKE